MHLHGIDRHHGRSPFAAVGPTPKILAVLIFATAVSLLTDPPIILAALTFALAALALARPPPGRVAVRYGLGLPFILFAALTQYLVGGPWLAAAMALRLSAGVLALIFLSMTTEFHDILRGLRDLRVPRIITGMLLLTHRYIFVLGDELSRMRLARRAKAHRPGKHMLDRSAMKTLSNTAGMLLVRAYRRGLRVQDGLRMRGFDGTFGWPAPVREHGAAGIALFSCFAGLSAWMLWLQWGAVG